MAEKSTPESANREHNVKDILAITQGTAEEMYALNRQIEKAKEVHVKPLQDKLRDVKQKWKGATGFALKDLGIHFKQYERVRLAKEVLAEDDGPTIIDNNAVIREAFEKLEQGKSVDLVEAVQQDDYGRWKQATEQNPEAITVVQSGSAWLGYSAAASTISREGGIGETAAKTQDGEVALVSVPANRIKTVVSAVQKAGFDVAMVSQNGDSVLHQKIAEAA